MGSGIYGDMLAAVPELLEEHVVFKMRPKHGAGYGARYDERSITGYVSYIKGGKYGVAGDNRVENQNITLWVEAEDETDDQNGKGVIQQGDYLEASGDLFIVNHDDGYVREGGFLVYTLQLVPAFTGRQKPDAGVSYGVTDYN